MSLRYLVKYERHGIYSDPGGMQSWVDLVGWLNAEIIYPAKDGHPSQY